MNDHYPTEDAYRAACAALEKHRERANNLEAQLAEANAKLTRISAERAEVYQARTGNSENGLPLWQHSCGAVEAFLSTELAEIKGGCDACESGSDNPEDWQELYRGPVYGRWTQEDIEQAKAAAAERWGRLSEYIEPVDDRVAEALLRLNENRPTLPIKAKTVREPSADVVALDHYPTEDAYRAACAALEKHRARADDLEAELAKTQRRIEDLERPGRMIAAREAADRARIVSHNHYCLVCSDGSTPGPGCGSCRQTGMDQTPCVGCPGPQVAVKAATVGETQ